MRILKTMKGKFKVSEWKGIPIVIDGSKGKTTLAIMRKVRQFLDIVDEPMTVKEIARKLDWPVSSSFRFCVFLERAGFAMKGPTKVNKRWPWRQSKTYVRFFTLKAV